MRDTNLVNALRCCADNSLCKCCNCELYCEKNCGGVLKNAAADLIENQQRHIEAQTKEIDTLRNELCLKCGNYTLAHEGACNGCRCEKQERCCPHEFYDSIEQAITDSEDGVPCNHLIEVEPVRHGRWIDLGDNYWERGRTSTRYKCSECGRRAGQKQAKLYHYCPNCGAKMDLEG